MGLVISDNFFFCLVVFRSIAQHLILKVPYL